MNSQYIQLIKSNPELWDLFTRKEEYNPDILDQFGRFSYYQSNNRDILKPSVSQYLVENGFHPEYPDGKSFAVCLTHDIDVVNHSVMWKGIGGLKAIYKRDWPELGRQVSYARSKKRPYNNFEDIMALEAEYDARSSFYFMALEDGQQDHNYSLHQVESEIGTIIDAGWEVGLHGSHEAYCDYDQICREKARLEKITGIPVVGYRNHYLRFRVPDTWEYLSRAGFLYDTTVGYADCVGFRNGMCHPYRPYNLNTDSVINILEIPLVVMDGTLYSDHMGLTPDVAMDCVKRLIDLIAECRGVFTLLWHNSMFLDGTMEKEMYGKILEYCYERNAWMTSGAEIAEWVNNSYVQ